MIKDGLCQNIESCSLSSKLIGFFGGTFDPPHFGHLQLAREMQKIYGLDEIWFCPAKINPFKEKSPPVSGENRVKMLRLIAPEIPDSKIITIELEKEGLSYTIDTLKTLTSTFEKYRFRLILGEDAALDFSKWKDPLQIIELAPPLVGARSSLDFPKNIEGDKPILEALQKGWTPINFLEISSTEVRKRLKKGLDCSHFLPAKVLDFIMKNHLYSS